MGRNLCCVLLVVVLAAAQAGEEQIITVNVDLVNIYFTVGNRKGRLITNLGHTPAVSPHPMTIGPACIIFLGSSGQAHAWNPGFGLIVPLDRNTEIDLPVVELPVTRDAGLILAVYHES